MLRLTLDIVPHGDESRKSTIGAIEICNVTPQGFAPGEGVADYKTFYCEGGCRMLQRSVKKYNRAYGAWHLAKMAIESLEIALARFNAERGPR